MPTYEHLSGIRHPDYEERLWKRIRALYSGSKMKEKLAADPELRKDLFPQHNAEEDHVYKERLSRSFYIPYPGKIIDAIVSSLTSDPLQMYVDQDGKKLPSDSFYEYFFSDTSPPGCSKTSVNQLMRLQILTALLLKRAWTLIDLPNPNKLIDLPPTSLADQETMGLLRAYAVPVDPESVIDWECDDYGELLWALIHNVTTKRPDIESKRSLVKEQWKYYTRTGWTEYTVEYDPKTPPKKDDEIPVTDEGSHSFQRVPLIPFTLPEGLWAGGKIESVATEFYNKRNALSWGEYKSCFQFLVAKLAPPDPMNALTEDGERAVNQKIGSGRIMVLGDKDSLEYLGPNHMPFEVIMHDLDNLKNEMFQVLHYMAASVENSGVALKRSGESKRMDHVETLAVLKTLGQYGREHISDIYEMVGAGRGDALMNWKADGWNNFKDLTLDTLVTDMVALEEVSLPSEEYQIRRKLRFMLSDLGDGIPDDVKEQMEAELRKNVPKQMKQLEEMKVAAPVASKKTRAVSKGEK